MIMGILVENIYTLIYYLHRKISYILGTVWGDIRS